jgi:phosphoribosylaminoimidazole (AIR) synthetase
MGIGMVACIGAGDEASTLELLKAEGIECWRIGRVVRGTDGVVIR